MLEHQKEWDDIDWLSIFTQFLQGMVKHEKLSSALNDKENSIVYSDMLIIPLNDNCFNFSISFRITK